MKVGDITNQGGNGTNGTGYATWGTPIWQKILLFGSVNATHTGNYTIVATNAAGSVTSNVVTLNVTSPSIGRLANLSVLTNVASPGDSFTMGYVVGGAGTSGAKPILIRAVVQHLARLPST